MRGVKAIGDPRYGNEFSITDHFGATFTRSMPTKTRLLVWSYGQGILQKIIIISLTILTRNEARLPNGRRNNEHGMGIGRRGNGGMDMETIYFL
jgi:hypothetical protein